MTYKISEQRLNEKKRNIILITALMPLLMVFFFALFAYSDGNTIDLKIAGSIIGWASVFYGKPNAYCDKDYD